MTFPSGCWSGASGIACANEAKAKAKTIAFNLIISFALDPNQGCDGPRFEIIVVLKNDKAVQE